MVILITPTLLSFFFISCLKDCFYIQRNCSDNLSTVFVLKISRSAVAFHWSQYISLRVSRVNRVATINVTDCSEAAEHVLLLLYEYASCNYSLQQQYYSRCHDTSQKEADNGCNFFQSDSCPCCVFFAICPPHTAIYSVFVQDPICS